MTLRSPPEFYYHAFGEDVRTLNVYLKQGNELGAPVWTRNRNQGNRWLKGEVRIRNPPKPYQIVFEGVSGGFYGGVSFSLKKTRVPANQLRSCSFNPLFKIIALDDIRIASKCEAASYRFCDFESEDICNYTIISSTFNWTRMNSLESGGVPSADQ